MKDEVDQILDLSQRMFDVIAHEPIDITMMAIADLLACIIATTRKPPGPILEILNEQTKASHERVRDHITKAMH